MREIILLAHDIRSCHNIGSLLRTAEGLGVQTVYFTGYSPYPSQDNDSRLPHIHQKLTKQIQKTALGAEDTQPWQHHEDINQLIDQLKKDGFTVLGLEQTDTSVSLHTYTAPQKIALLIGREVEGIEPALIEKLDEAVVIPMYGQKESFNVVQATAMCLYQLRFH